MRIKRLAKIASAVLFCVAASGVSARADLLLNGGFESGNLQGWRVNVPRATSPGISPRLTGSALVTSSWSPGNMRNPLESAMEGNLFGVLSSVSEFRLGGSRAFNITMTQRIHLGAGETISGAAAFFSQSSMSRDSAWITILDSDGISLASPWRSTPETDHDASTLWQDWSWLANRDGDYYLGLGLTTYCDHASPSYGFFDAISIQPVQTIVPVPEPSSLSVVALAAGAALWRRRFNLSKN